MKNQGRYRHIVTSFFFGLIRLKNWGYLTLTRSPETFLIATWRQLFHDHIQQLF